MAKKDPDDLIDESPGIGHNSATVPGKELVKIIEHVEALIEQRGELSDAIREAMETAKIKGYDKRTIREVIKLRALEDSVRKEREDFRDAYLAAVGLI